MRTRSPARTLDATAISQPTAAVTIVGATIVEPGVDTPTETGPAAQRPLVLPVAARACILLGAAPGQITWVPPAPAEPAWMKIAGLQYGVFEFAPSFNVVWVLTEHRHPPTQKARLRSAQPPATLAGQRTHPMTAWATTILEWQPPTGPSANALWDTYMESAELVLEA